MDGYVIALACRVVMGVGLNAVYAAAHQIEGSIAAVTMGVAAPLIIKQMATRSEQASQPAGTSQLATLPNYHPGSDEHAPIIEQSAGGVDAR